MKGFDRFRTTGYEEGADVVLAALEPAGFAVTYVRGHEISARLPKTAEELDAFDVVVLSDIGSNSFLIPDETFLRSERSPNKLTVLGDHVGGGGGTLARWPSVLGFDRVVAKPGATVVARAGEDPLLVVGGYGGGRVAAFTADLAPHWAPPEFVEWAHCASLWTSILSWAARVGSDSRTVTPVSAGAHG